MHFCNICSNMYYIKINDNNNDKLIYYCRKCGNEDKNLASNSLENNCVSKIVIKKDSNNGNNGNSYSHIVNKFTKLDPTLPRINNILCPNVNCLTNTENKEKEVLYIRYDDTNMKYIYLCAICDIIWKA